MIENLSNIKKFGIRRFVKSENEKWRCLQCGEMLCVHKPECPSCGRMWRGMNKLMGRGVSEGR
jgi:rubrerythrin